MQEFLTDEIKSNLDAWYNRIKFQLTTKAKENYCKRLQEITNIANGTFSKYDYQLIITENDKSKMWNGIAGDIDSWKGVEITACTKIKTDYKGYAITSRNWWNRNKAKIYGNHFFYPIIFCHIQEACFKVQNISDDDKICLFVEIFNEILHAKIQFPQTRAQPIIPHQSFIQPNKFKYSAIDLLKKYGIHWNGKDIEGLGVNNNNNKFSDDDTNSTNSNSSNTQQRQSYYIKDKDRSLKVNNSYIDCLDALEKRLQFLTNKGDVIKIKTESTTSGSCSNRNQYNPPSIRKNGNNGSNACDGINIANFMNHSNSDNYNKTKTSLRNRGNAVNTAPVPNLSNVPQTNNIPSISNISTAPMPVHNNNDNNNNNNNNIAFNGNGVNILNIAANLPALLNGLNDAAQMSMSSPLSQISDTTQPPNTNLTNFNSNIVPPIIAENAMINFNTQTTPNNGYQPMYGAYHGQTNSVSNQRYSPLSAPLNNMYCSIKNDPVSGKLVLSLHIPLDC